MIYSKALLFASLLWLGLAADSMYHGNFRFGIIRLIFAVAGVGAAYCA